MAARKFSFTGSGELRVAGGGRTLAAAGDVIAIGDRVFRPAEVGRVAYHAAARPHQAGYALGWPAARCGAGPCLTRSAGAAPEPELVTAMAGWNAVVLPRVAGMPAGREKESPGSH
ncbi:hypothetical protein [Amycolatopsis sp. cmx-4-68]|uniref:hypothetical protein n=1 Tax=Amycolatopsis sp. cmx-4-68 TaxID=2790938 RepID=UPI003979F5AF